MSKEKTINRKARAIETKNRIYETADLLFRKYGFERISVDSIVKAAGVSKGTFYVHFDSKDALIAARIADFVNELDLDYKSYLESFPADTPASDLLTSLAEKITDIIACTIGYDNMRFIYQVQITRTIDTDAILGYSRDLYKVFNEIISRGVQQGEFAAEIPVNTLAKHCVMAIRGLTYEWCIRHPEFDLKVQALKHFEILLKGIKKK